MAQEYITLSEDALSRLCSLIKAGGGGVDIIDDKNVAINSVYSSAKITELFDNIKTAGGTGGKGISSIEFESSSLGGETAGIAGATDTYTITYSDNTTDTFSVYNGKNGTNGVRYLPITTSPTGGSGTLDDGTRYYNKIKLTTALNQSQVDEIYTTDMLLYQAKIYPVVGFDDTYVYLGSPTTIKGDAGISPTIGNNGNWYIGNEDTGVSAGGATGTIKVKTGKLAATHGNLQEIPVHLYNSIDGNFIDNVFYGITRYAFVETTVNADGMTINSKEIQMSQLSSGVNWNGELISFIATKISGITYFFFILKDTSGYETLYAYQSTSGSIIDDYANQGNLNIHQITDVTNEPKFMLINGYVYLAYYTELQDYTVIMTNDPKYNKANELTRFIEVYPEGNRFMGDWQVWGSADFIFFKNFNNTNEPFKIWKPSNDKIHYPVERSDYGETEPYHFSHMVYCKKAKCFIAYEDSGQFYYRHFSGCENLYLSNWDEGNISGDITYSPYCIIATNNYLFVYNYEGFVDMYDKDFNLLNTINRSRFTNIFEIPTGIVFWSDTGDTVIYLFETEEITIEEAINRLV